jgi:NADH-quinone oxidoreductase subunit C
MTTSIAPKAPYLAAQENLTKRLVEKYGTDRKVEFDKLNEPIIWAKSPEDAKVLFKSFMLDDVFKMDFLSDITAYDNKDHEDGNKRFVLVYQQYSTILHVRVRIKCLLDENEEALTLSDVFSGANWLERDVFDMFGITFKGHPNMRRILMDERFTGHPLRKEYPIKQREPFKDNIAFHLGANPKSIDTHIIEGEEN